MSPQVCDEARSLLGHSENPSSFLPLTGEDAVRQVGFSREVLAFLIKLQLITATIIPSRRAGGMRDAPLRLSRLGSSDTSP